MKKLRNLMPEQYAIAQRYITAIEKLRDAQTRLNTCQENINTQKERLEERKVAFIKALSTFSRQYDSVGILKLRFATSGQFIKIFLDQLSPLDDRDQKIELARKLLESYANTHDGKDKINSDLISLNDFFNTDKQDSIECIKRGLTTFETDSSAIDGEVDWHKKIKETSQSQLNKMNTTINSCDLSKLIEIRKAYNETKQHDTTQNLYEKKIASHIDTENLSNQIMIKLSNHLGMVRCINILNAFKIKYNSLMTEPEKQIIENKRTDLDKTGGGQFFSGKSWRQHFHTHGRY